MYNYKANSETITDEMLKTIGEKSLDDLYSMIDKKARMSELTLPEAMSEMEVQRTIKSIAKENKTDYACFLGAGAYNRFIPAAISQISSRFEFNTAYTPYQPEISQGTLQVIYEFQSMICDLTGMEVCNASVYDAGNACAEAMLMASRISGKDKILVSTGINPEYIEVVKTYAHAGNIEIELAETKDLKTDITNISDKLKSGEYAGFIIQNPNFFGSVEDIDILKDIERNSKTMLIVCSDLMSNAVLMKPGEYGADIVVGDVQSFGNTLSFGGPYAGFIAAKDKYKRQMPGRIVGRTLDIDGRQAFTLTLQAREQHIRREKATSNICSNQGLAILNAVIYLALMGKKGIQQAAYLSAKNAKILSDELKKKGFNVINKDYFNEFVLEVKNADLFLKTMKDKGILAGVKINDGQILVCTTEMNTEEEIKHYIQSV